MQRRMDDWWFIPHPADPWQEQLPADYQGRCKPNADTGCDSRQRDGGRTIARSVASRKCWREQRTLTIGPRKYCRPARPTLPNFRSAWQPMKSYQLVHMIFTFLFKGTVHSCVLLYCAAGRSWYPSVLPLAGFKLVISWSGVWIAATGPQVFCLHLKWPLSPLYYVDI